MTNLEKYIRTQEKLTELRIDYFFEHVLFSYQWWLLIIFTIVPWLIWWKLVDRRRLKAILACGLMIALLAIILDDIGLTMSLWAYPYQTFFVTSRMNSVDMAILPVFYMLIYQYFTKWPHYTAVVLLFAFFAAYIAGPLFDALGMYIKLKWEYFYSVPVYFLIGVLAKWIIDKVKNVSE